MLHVRPTHTRLLLHYLLLTYFGVLLNASSFLRDVEYAGAITPFFVAAVYLTYSFLYLLPVFLLLFLLDRLLIRLVSDQSVRSLIIYSAAVLGTALVQLLIFVDKFIFKMYGFHLNGFVWNLVFTRGGIDSLGGGGSTTLYFTLIVVGFLVLQTVLLVVLVRSDRVRSMMTGMLPRRRMFILAGLFVCAGVFERVVNGMANLHGNRPVLMASSAFPLYIPTSFTEIAHSMGVKVDQRPTMQINVESGRLRYPREQIHRDPAVKPLNIVWIVTESLRADMLDPEIMPATYAFAQQAGWFRNHYSGGNGTRMGMFSLFYGLYGCSWFSFLESQRGPVLFDVLKASGYQMKMFTSQSFTYPEFDKTDR